MAKRKSTFSFDLSKPIKRGQLLKQGKVHKAFKYREFMVYPGFLVYYESENKWRLDLIKGDTLGNRQGAIKLKGASVSVAHGAPKGCKYGLTLTAPDPTNKRQTYLMNASSREERDSWIENIRKGIPISPHMRRKDKSESSDPKQQTSSKPKEKTEDEEKPSVSHPSYTERQDTACVAATTLANSTDTTMEQKAIDEAISNVNSSLKDMQPVSIGRHDTATLAALSVSTSGTENGLGDERETSIDDVIRNEDEEIDDILGDHKNTTASSSDDAGSSQEVSRSSTPHHNPVSSEPRDEMATNESVESSQNIDGKTTVTTTVTVTCSTENSPTIGRKEEKEEGSGPVISKEEKEEKGEVGDVPTATIETVEVRERSSSSTQVLVSDSDGNTSISVNLNSYDSDDTLSDEESHADLEPIGDKKEEELEEVPAITIESTNSVKKNRSESSGSSNEGSPKLSLPESRRRSSTPFIEKNGFLYKLGGKRKTWKLRYFILRPGVFKYFKNNYNNKPLGEVKLKNLSIFFPGVGERKQSFQFTIHTESTWNSRADWVMAAQSEREMKEWITAFKLAGQKIGSASVSPMESEEEVEAENGE